MNAIAEKLANFSAEQLEATRDATSKIEAEAWSELAAAKEALKVAELEMQRAQKELNKAISAASEAETLLKAKNAAKKAD